MIRTMPEIDSHNALSCPAPEMKAGREMQKGLPLVTSDDFREVGAIAYGTPTPLRKRLDPN